MQNLEVVPVWEALEEAEVTGSMSAQTRAITLIVKAIDPKVEVMADRQILAAMIANLLQNAFKFSPRASTVRLQAVCSANRVLIEVEDQCGGLPPGKTESLLRPFSQQGADRSGLGLGLSICLKAAHAMAGELRIRDMPSKGCVFTIDLPRVLPAESSPAV